ncbi:MAG: hypothetical protein ABW122_10520 [Ilumatobacteraceae bacterium]
MDAYGKESIVAQVTIERVCFDANPDVPASALGGGTGGEITCETRPFGPLAEVEAVWAAVNADQAPVVADPTYEEDVLIPLDPSVTPTVVTRSWFRVEGQTAQVKYMITCPGELSYERWLTVTPDAVGTATPQIRATDLLPALQAQVIRQLPTPVPRIGPADEDDDGWTYVNNRTFFWIDQIPGQWDTVSGSTGVGGVSVTVQAVPTRLVVDPGDGAAPVVCDGVPTAVTKAAYFPAIQGCDYTYRNSSAMAPNGESYPVTATIVWHASWSASTGEGGDLGYVSTTSPVRDLQVAEIQSIIVFNDP